MSMQIGINTFHLTQRFGLNDKGQFEKESVVRSVMFLKEAGVHLIELLLDTKHLRPPHFDSKTKETLLDLKEKGGITYTVHFPMRYLDISSISQEIRKFSVKCMQEAVKCCEKLDIKTYVLHLTGHEVNPMVLSPYISQNVKIALLDEMISNAERSLSEILQIIPPDKLCIENLPNIPFRFFYQLVEKLNTSICFDVGHCVCQGEDPLSFFDRYSGRIKEIHLHDVTKTRNHNGCIHLVDHQALGTGILDLERFIKYLKQRNFGGYLILEFMNEKEALSSWQTLCSLIGKNETP